MLYFINFLLGAYLFLCGSCIGSFLNVVIYRVPRGISIAKGRSFCPGCGHTLRPLDLVPVFSFLFLRGRCRYCQMKISRRYPLVETIMGLAALLVFGRTGLTLSLPIEFAAASILAAAAFIDQDTMTIPNSLIVALAVPALALAVFVSQPGLLSRVIGFFVLSLPMFLLTLAIPDGFGMGDVKLIAVCGFLLGWENNLVAGFIALLLGVGYGIFLMIRDKNNRHAHIAFGPYLCIGVFTAMLYGNELIDGYMRLFGL